jgi:uncharacterized protein YhfF
MKYFLMIFILLFTLTAKAATLHPSVQKMWDAYQATLSSAEKSQSKALSSWYFDDNQKDADELAELALRGTKRGTATLLFDFEHKNQPLPKKGELHVITNWKGMAQCIIQVTKVDIVRFNQFSEEFARIEGEGGGALDYWRTTHINYFQRYLKPKGKIFTEDMPVVFEQFRVVWPISKKEAPHV